MQKINYFQHTNETANDDKMNSRKQVSMCIHF